MSDFTVTLETIFGELLEEYPASEVVLKKYLGAAYCLVCPGKMFDNIGNGAAIHGLDDDTAEKMVADLQDVVDKTEKGELTEEMKEAHDKASDPDAAPAEFFDPFSVSHEEIMRMRGLMGHGGDEEEDHSGHDHAEGEGHGEVEEKGDHSGHDHA